MVKKTIFSTHTVDFPTCDDRGVLSIPKRHLPISEHISVEAEAYLTGSYVSCEALAKKIASGSNEYAPARILEFLQDAAGGNPNYIGFGDFSVASERVNIGGVIADVVYPLSNAQAEGGANIWIHFGGGYSQNETPINVALYLAGRFAVKVFVPHYKLVSQSKENIIEEQKLNAIFFYRELQKTYDAKEICLVGESSGAHVVVDVVEICLSSDIKPPGAIALFSYSGRSNDSGYMSKFLDPISLKQYLMSWVLGASSASHSPRIDFLKHSYQREIELKILREFPPSILISGTRDVSLSSTIDFHRKLHRAGILAELSIYEGMPHAHHLVGHLPEAVEALNEVGDYFCRVLEK